MYLLTGASKGIGRYLLDNLNVESEEKILALYNSTVPELIHPNVEWCKVDLADPVAIARLLDNKIADLTRIKFINCAGINYNAVTHKFPEDEWAKVLQVNLTSTFFICKLLLPLMRKEEYGKIVFLSSIVAQTGVVGSSAYAASKAGLWGLMKTIVQENGSKGITCNTLNLGYFDIGIIREVPGKILDEIKSRIPSKTLGNAADIFKTIDLLMNTSYINGASIDLNGGLYLS